MTNPKPLSPEERVEAAAREMANVEWQSLGGEARRFLRLDAELVLKAAFPEYFAGTHVLAPRKPTEEMVRAVWEDMAMYPDDDGSLNKTIEILDFAKDRDLREIYTTMLSANESTSTSTEDQEG